MSVLKDDGGLIVNFGDLEPNNFYKIYKNDDMTKAINSAQYLRNEPNGNAKFLLIAKDTVTKENIKVYLSYDPDKYSFKSVTAGGRRVKRKSRRTKKNKKTLRRKMNRKNNTRGRK